ncbi:AMP-binding protein [Acetobacter thailandicus]|uniref:AMP-binding protein n=1 Tax=Acetobacter thailandicus TaxID=1502842 RepID=A0ABT3QC54_9PROT|nr:AMP-binding protein [Acetobacter thailandicus]MCX2562849.1 AMP-binding protein [Acetobacter thailandicus]NHN95744.1 AMP-binding protein [Acetobacter thailandicus]
MLVDIIHDKLKNTSGEIIFRDISREWSYGEFHQNIVHVAHALGKIKEAGCALVGVKCASQYNHLVIIFALDMLGVASVSLPEGFGSMFRSYVELTKPDLILTDDSYEGDIPSVKFSGLSFPSTLHMETIASDERSPDEICRVSVAAGTDVTARKIYIDATNFHQNIHRLIQSVNEMRSADKYDVFCFLGIDLLSGFQIRLAAILSGGCLNFFNRSNIHYLFRRERPSVFILSPLHLEILVSALPPLSRPDDTVEIIVIGGALPPELEKKTRAGLSTRIHVIYGTEETGAVAVRSVRDGLAPESAGFIVPWMTVEAVDQDNKKIKEGNVAGLLRIQGDTLNKGYLEEYFSDRFVGGWFYPGDIGRIYNQKELFIVSRADNLISFGGDKFSVARLDEVCKAYPGIQDGCIFAVPDASGVHMPYVAIICHEQIDISELSRKMHDIYENMPTLTVIWVDQIPLDDAGNPDRVLLTEMVLNERKQRSARMH